MHVIQVLFLSFLSHAGMAYCAEDLRREEVWKVCVLPCIALSEIGRTIPTTNLLAGVCHIGVEGSILDLERAINEKTCAFNVIYF